ncbi:GNAT family N-acetyltransferase [Micromonospora sp. DT233]|uniref:GNAT family N-acetyltransferase n=1 Tax=Micromonospora sp. DT233 TaxID=3393432 RepID=UPI003CE6FBF8
MSFPQVFHRNAVPVDGPAGQRQHRGVDEAAGPAPQTAEPAAAAEPAPQAAGPAREAAGPAREAAGPVPLGDLLRALRRRADLSQRQLAERSGVPQATLARIEAGRVGDPRFRTVERLVHAAGGRLAPPEQFPLPLPAATYELNRRYRDQRRWANQVRREVSVRRVTDEGLPATQWRFVAELPDGRRLGELRAHERSPRLLYGDLVPAGEREIVLDGVLVTGACRRLGIGRRLMEALTGEMDRAGITVAHAVAEAAGIHLLVKCGYRIETSRPYALCLDRSVGRRNY